jgi:ERCC4-type nuclease
MPRKPRQKKPPLTIIEDTREQTPLTDWPGTVAVENGTLHTGDYSIKGWENCFTIERKSLTDFAGTMMGGYEAHSEKPKKRFNRELERMRHYDLAAVVVTATAEEVLSFHHHCGEDAHGALWGFALSIFATYGVPVFFIGNPALAARWIADLARHYVAVRTKKNFTKADLSAKVLADWAFD